MKKFAHVLILLLSIYLGYIFTNIASPRVQFFLDFANYENAGTVEIFKYDTEYRSLSADADGVYSTDYIVYGEPVNISFSVADVAPINVKINGKDFFNIDKISKYTVAPAYSSTYVLKTDYMGFAFFPVLFLFTAIFLATFEFVFNKVILASKDKMFKVIYSKTGFASVGKKLMIVPYIVAAVSLIIYHGCDLVPLAESIKLSSSGTDIFQLFACLNKYKDIELFIWQYDGTMLAFYKLVSFISYLLFKFDVNSYHLGYTILYKFVNITLLNLTAISLVSFMIEHNVIPREKAKNIYLWTVLNPVTLYVAVIFIQFDALPLYLFTLGVLLLDNIEENKILPFLLIALGITCKIPMMMTMPVIGMMGLYFLLKSRGNELKKIILYFIFFIIMLVVAFLLPRILHSPLGVAYSGMRAAQRMWWTTVQYAPVVYLFVTVMVIEILCLLNYVKLNLKISVVDLIQNSLLVVAAIVYGFSFSVLSTPGIFIVTLPAFAFMYAKQEDNLQRFIFGFGGLLMVVYVLFSSIGDISAASIFFGGKAYFTEIEHMYSGTPTGTQINSVLHTVSNSAMLAYAVIFFKEAGKHFKKKNELVKN